MFAGTSYYISGWDVYGFVVVGLIGLVALCGVIKLIGACQRC